MESFVYSGRWSIGLMGRKQWYLFGAIASVLNLGFGAESTSRTASLPNMGTMSSSAPVQTPAADYVENSGIDLRLQMTYLPAGLFTMGSAAGSEDERPAHTVKLNAFWIGKCEVTQDQFERVMGRNPSSFQGRERPVDSATWAESEEFCAKLTKLSGRKYALPTEAQWEYACRAGSDQAYCFGDSDQQLGEYAWYSVNSEGSTHPVGTKMPNKWNLHDMHGNVWEWCRDSYEPDYSSASGDGESWTGGDGPFRVIRGGSWFYCKGSCRSFFRYTGKEEQRSSHIGFRVTATEKN